jgi:hypothetical protein
MAVSLQKTRIFQGIEQARTVLFPQGGAAELAVGCGDGQFFIALWALFKILHDSQLAVRGAGPEFVRHTNSFTAGEQWQETGW